MAWVARSGFASLVFLILLVVGAGFLVLLLVRQYRKPEPLMPLKMITHTMPLTGLGIAMVAGAAVTALVELSVLYLTKVAHETPLACGGVLATQVLGVIVAAWLFKRLLPTRWLPAYAFTGLGVVAIGSAVLLLSPDDALIVTAFAGLLLGGVRPHAPDLPRWIAGDQPAFHSPRVAAAVRDDGGEHRLA